MQIGGIKVVDANEPLILIIQKRDVELGNTKDPGACAAARACIRQLHASAARIHLSKVYVRFKNKWVRYNTPHSLRTEIIAFDRGGGFNPGEHYLTRPQPTKHLGKRFGGKDKPPTKPKKKRSPYHVLSNIRAHGVVGGGED